MLSISDVCASAFEKLRLDGVIDDEGARAKTKTQILAGRMQGMNFPRRIRWTTKVLFLANMNKSIKIVLHELLYRPLPLLISKQRRES